MGDEVVQSEVLKTSAGCSLDEVDRAAPPSEDVEDSVLIVKCEGKSCDGSAVQPLADKSPKKPTVPSTKPRENSLEKSKKWYNIGFMNRVGSSTNSRSANTADNKNSTNMDNRHSWHLNDSSEMWVPFSILSSLIIPFWSSSAYVCLDFLLAFVSNFIFQHKKKTNGSSEPIIARPKVLEDIKTISLRLFRKQIFSLPTSLC